MQKSLFFNIKAKKMIIYIFLIFIFLIIISHTVAAEYFQAGLKDYINDEHLIKVPVFNLLTSIELSSDYGAVLSSPGAEDFTLKTGQKYIITLGSTDFKTAFQKQKAEEESAPPTADKASPETIFSVQVLASSTRENAEQKMSELKKQLDVEMNIIEEGGLFKLLLGNFSTREEVEAFESELESLEIEGWIKVQLMAQDTETAAPEAGDDSLGTAAQLVLYNSSGEKIREADSFQISGYFNAGEKELSGDFKFSSLNEQLMLRGLTDLDRLTASLLSSYLSVDTPREALKAQAVIYRTALLYQLQTHGPELAADPAYDFGLLEPAFKNAVRETKDQILVRDDSFYYDTDFELRSLNKPRTGTTALAQADYSWQEIIDYYYKRAEVVDLNEVMDSELKFTANISYGLKFKEMRQFNWQGPRLITVIDYDLNVERLSLKPVLAGGLVPGREDLGELIKRHEALAGVNGGYFHYSGRPLGLLYLEGELVSEPLNNRTALLIDEDGGLKFEQVSWQGVLNIDSAQQKIELDGVNRSTAAGEAVLFNSYYGKTVPQLKNRYYDIVVRSGIILGVEDQKGSRSVIPPDGYIIRVEKTKEDILALIPQLGGQSVQLEMEFRPDFEELGVLHAVGGGPGLIEAGEIRIRGAEERFQPDVLDNRSPRTALGLTADQHLIMLTVDGRQQGTSIGMSLEELAHLLKELGAVEAMNLDGGGSARMVVRGLTVNSPSEKRYISSGILVDDK